MAAIIVVDGAVMRDLPAFSIAPTNLRDRPGILTDRQGTECCCGPAACASERQCVDACCFCSEDTLEELTTTFQRETWAGFRHAGLCDYRQPGNPCEVHHPAACAALDTSESYYRASIKRTSATLDQSTPIILGGCRWGQMDAIDPYLMNETIEESGRYVWNSVCQLDKAPSVITSQFPFEFVRCNGGWIIENLGGTFEDTNCVGLAPCLGPANCQPGSCTAQDVLDDLLCALLPHGCDQGQIAVNTGCILVQSGQEPYCSWDRIDFHFGWRIQRNGTCSGNN